MAFDINSGSLSVLETRRILSELITKLAEESGTKNSQAFSESILLEDAVNRILAKDLLSPINVPNADNSAMDGYAFKGQANSSNNDLQKELKIVGTALAGKPFLGQVGDTECIKIMTGALMPATCDSVIPQELITKVMVNAAQENCLFFSANAVKAGENRRLQGEDLRLGQVAIPAGRILRPSDLGLAASLGIKSLLVRRKLRVAIISSGNELRSLDQPLDAGSVYDSNRYSLIGLLTRLNLEIIDGGIVQDDPQTLKNAFRNAALKADVLISSGGVSVGEADFTKQVLQELGEVGFWQIAMRPGRPMAFGVLKPDLEANNSPANSRGSTLFFGLPGNPVAVMVTFYQFVRSALLQLNGATVTTPPTVQVRSAENIRKKPGRTEFQRGIVTLNEAGQASVRTTGSQGAGILRSMSEANCFIILPAEQGNIQAGDLVQVEIFEGLL
ncbi:MAG: molybdopterin molybdotransferase MoeA [Polynucleobacter sp.]|nr:molybdopterin molybdotransferase MoeA [Polynucleobacter sp.]